jgi:hypothetical protein
MAYLAFMISLAVLGSVVTSWRGDTCADGWGSPSIGQRGACSHHGGVQRASGLVLLASFLIPVGIGIYVYVKAGEGRKRRYAPPRRTPRPQHKIAAPACSVCGRKMRLRKASVGKYAGKRFWGCIGFPTCKNILPYRSDQTSDGEPLA